MKISRSQLKLLIENYVFEIDSSEESKNINYENSFKIGNYEFVIKINNKTGVNVEVKTEEKATNNVIIDNEKEISEIIAGILNYKKSNKKDMQKLVDAYKNANPENTLDEPKFRTHLVNFRSKYDKKA